MKKPLISGDTWTINDLPRVWEAVQKVAKKYGYNYYTPDFQIVTDYQMLEMSAGIGLPIHLPNWRVGGDFLDMVHKYNMGMGGVALELIINSNPSLVFLLETINAVEVIEVIAHAAVGHSDFFKNHYLFSSGTDANSIISYMQYASNFIQDCEKQYGTEEVAIICDQIRCWEYHGIFKNGKPKRKTKSDKIKKIEILNMEKELLEHKLKEGMISEDNMVKRLLELEKEIFKNDPMEKLKHLPQEFDNENILYFVEKYTKSLSLWQIEIVRIFRKISQYFYPQMKTKIMNEGWATFTHMLIINDLWEDGLITESQYIDCLRHNSRLRGLRPLSHDKGQIMEVLNPYWIGYNIFKKLQDVCTNPTELDYKLYPEYAGTDWVKSLRFICQQYTDSSFVSQFLHPDTIRDVGMIYVKNDSDSSYTDIEGDCREENIEDIRKGFALMIESSNNLAKVKIVNVTNDRVVLLIGSHDNREIDKKHLIASLYNLQNLLGYDIFILTEDEEGKTDKLSISLKRFKELHTTEVR